METLIKNIKKNCVYCPCLSWRLVTILPKQLPILPTWKEGSTSNPKIRKWLQKFCGNNESLGNVESKGPHTFENKHLKVIVEQNSSQTALSVRSTLGQ